MREFCPHGSSQVDILVDHGQTPLTLRKDQVVGPKTQLRILEILMHQITNIT